MTVTFVVAPDEVATRDHAVALFEAVAALIPVALVLAGLAPSVAAGGDGVRAMALGVFHACAVRSDERVWCWGEPRGPGGLDTGGYPTGTVHLHGQVRRW